MVFGLLTKPLVRLMLPSPKHLIRMLSSEPTTPKSFVVPLLGNGEATEADTEGQTVRRPTSLRMLLSTPTHTVHHYWRSAALSSRNLHCIVDQLLSQDHELYKEQGDSDDINNAKKIAHLLKTCPVPGAKSKRPHLSQLEEQDFIDKQRAYFEEIDAFELPVEEVSDMLRRFVWIYASMQFAQVVLFAHLFYSGKYMILHLFICSQQLQNQIAKQMQYGASIIQPQINHNYQQLHQQTIQQTSQLQSSQQSFVQALPSLYSTQPSLHQTTRSFAQSSADSVHQQKSTDFWSVESKRT